MKKLLLTLGMAGLLVGCGETTNINGLTEDDVERILSERGADTVYVVGGDTVEVRDTVSVTDTIIYRGKDSVVVEKPVVKVVRDTVVAYDTVVVERDRKAADNGTGRDTSLYPVYRWTKPVGTDSAFRDTAIVIGGESFEGVTINNVFYPTAEYPVKDFLLKNNYFNADTACAELPDGKNWEGFDVFGDVIYADSLVGTEYGTVYGLNKDKIYITFAYPQDDDGSKLLYDPPYNISKYDWIVDAAKYEEAYGENVTYRCRYTLK